MRTATAYYDGNQIVLNDEIRRNLTSGQRIQLVFTPTEQENETVADRRMRIVQSGLYSTSSGRTPEETEQMIKELRADDRL